MCVCIIQFSSCLSIAMPMAPYYYEFTWLVIVVLVDSRFIVSFPWVINWVISCLKVVPSSWYIAPYLIWSKHNEFENFCKSWKCLLIWGIQPWFAYQFRSILFLSKINRYNTSIYFAPNIRYIWMLRACVFVCVMFNKQNTMRLQHLNLLLDLIHQYSCGISFQVSISCFEFAKQVLLFGELFHLA